MPLVTRPRSALFLAGLTALVLAGVVPAAEEMPDTKALDRYLYSSLHYVINYGVDQYNTGEVDKCYTHFRNTLGNLVPVLAHHPDLQKFVEKALVNVEKDPEWRIKMAGRGALPSPEFASDNRQKAFALWTVLRDVRAGLLAASKPTVMTPQLNKPPFVIPPLDKPPMETLPVKPPVTPVTPPQSDKPPLPPPPPAKPPVTTPPAEKLPVTPLEDKPPLPSPPPKPPAEKAPVVKPEPEEPPPAAKKPTGNLMGKVVFEGKPVAGGLIVFHDEAADRAYSGMIGFDGSYAVMDVPAGKYTVTVASAKIALGGKPVDVPAKYKEAKTSGLTCEVKAGPQNLNLALQK